MKNSIDANHSVKVASAKASWLLLFGLLTLVMPTCAIAQNTSFSNIRWSAEDIPLDEVERSGNGSISETSTNTIRNSSGPFTFSLDGAEEGGSTDRQEYKMDRRGGYHAMNGRFQVNGTPDMEGGVSIAQTHDDGTGSSGVFAIYQINTRGRTNKWYFVPQTDNNNIDHFSAARIYPGTRYFVTIETFSDGSDSFERARIFQGSNTRGTLLRTFVINDGSGTRGSGSDADDQYKKFGAYLLSSSSAEDFEVVWDRIQFYTGEERN